MQVQFALLCEGTSDAALVAVLRRLLLEAGADSAIGEAIPLTGTIRRKFEHLIAGGKPPQLVFVHRDSDTRDPEPRYDEIRHGAEEAGWSGPVVCVVPIQMTEAWLLTSADEIRSVAGRANGRAPLNLPNLSEIERTSDAKARLRHAYLTASETTGRRRRTAESSFSSRRTVLLDRLDINGGVSQLASFDRLRRDLATALASLRA